MNQYVSFVEMETLWVTKRFDAAFSYYPQRGWAWLQRFAIKVLQWRGCHYVAETMEYRRINVPKRGLLEAVYRQHEELHGMLNGKPAVLLIGPDDFTAAMKEIGQDVCSPMHRWIRLDTDGYVFHGMSVSVPIVIVPWMKGVLMMPKALLT